METNYEEMESQFNRAIENKTIEVELPPEEGADEEGYVA
jgi:hypothetical protein